jgi:adenine phosphoribosyltransferase
VPQRQARLLSQGLATGDTTGSAINRISQRGGTVAGAACIIELSFLNGRDRNPVPTTAMVSYDS